MGLFGNRRNRRRLAALRDAPEATAVIVGSETVGAMGRREAGSTIFDIELNVLGTRAYLLTLEVRMSGREPYDVSGRFDVPRKAENLGFFDIANKLQPGIELPVRVDPSDPDNVAVDWERFVASPDRKRQVRAAKEAAQRVAVAKQIAKNPKMQAKMWANNRIAVQAWAGAVQAGQMSRDDFEKHVTSEVESGRMDPADAEAARRSLDGG